MPGSMRERMLAGELYIADDPEILEAYRRAQELAEAYNVTGVRDVEGGRDERYGAGRGAHAQAAAELAVRAAGQVLAVHVRGAAVHRENDTLMPANTATPSPGS